MSSLFVSVLRQAFKTFDRANQATFAGNLATLKQLMEQLTFRDMHLNQQQLLSDSAFSRPDSAPCTFVHIFENDVVSLSVFVMRGGFTMPLHDHPCMYGLLRGIYGKLRIQSYTAHQPTMSEPLIDPCTAREVIAVTEEPRMISENSECGILTPRECNFHEITAVDGVAAFFDILSPPYDADIPEYGTRRCRFYRALPLASANSTAVAATTTTTAAVAANAALVAEQTKALVKLECIPAPLSYYCDTAETPASLAESTFNCCAEAYSNKDSAV